MVVASGTHIGRYAVRARAGGGGMGEVYAAYDPQLNRAVALKLLPAEFALNSDRLARFQQEALAASALNHPGILTIYEIGESNGIYFIATEFVDGMTLRERLQFTTPELSESLSFAIQIASALAAAHEAGVVHRDIKPENVMIRPDGLVKILDFGIAKTNDGFTVVDREAATQAPTKTDPGMVLGTASYMSPEQARGETVDARTDIFSFGVVLYEMVTGRKPFCGDSNNDVIAAILDKQPASLGIYEARLPEALEWIVTKALMKEREERYQTAREMMVDLRRLKQKLEIEAELVRVNSDPEITLTRTTRIRSASPVGDCKSSSAEYLIEGIRTHKRQAALVFLVISIGVYKLSRKQPPAARSLKIVALTNSGKVSDAVVAPDGKYVAYVLDTRSGPSLRVKHVATLSETEIVAPAADVVVTNLTFSPDGSYIYFVRGDSLTSDLFQIAVLGGIAKRILSRVNSAVSFSPDGQKFAFVRHDNAEAEYRLVVAGKDGDTERVLTKRKDPNYLAWPAWSPDGRTIAYAAGNFEPGRFYWNLGEVNVGDATESRLGEARWWWIGGLGWLNDGSGLIISAREIRAATALLWQVAHSTGEAHPLANDANWYSGTSLTSDSKILVATRSDLYSSIWIGHGQADLMPIAGNKDEGSIGLSWAPNGQIVSSNIGAGQGEVWIMNADGSERKLIGTIRAHNLVVSPSGQQIIYDSVKAGTFNVWQMRIDGSDPVQLTSGAVEMLATYSPDGQWIYYTSGTFDNATVWKVSAAGGNPIQVCAKRSIAPSVSPDGSMLAFYLLDDADGIWKLALADAAAGVIKRSFLLPVGVDHMTAPQWLPDGRAITFSSNSNGVSKIWSQSSGGEPAREVFIAKSDRILRFSWSREGMLAVSRGIATQDIVLVSDFR